jgi:hypothetical protein
MLRTDLADDSDHITAAELNLDDSIDRRRWIGALVAQ